MSDAAERIKTVLTSRERLILIFEDTHPAAGGTKDERIRETFGFSAVRYYQQLLSLISRQDAEEEFPQLVHRMRRLSLERSARRSALAA